MFSLGFSLLQKKVDKQPYLQLVYFNIPILIQNIIQNNAGIPTTLKAWPASKHIGHRELKILPHVKCSKLNNLAFKIISNSFSKNNQIDIHQVANVRV